MQPQVLDRYVTVSGDAVQVNQVGERAGLALFDVEVIHDGDVVDYHEDITGWQLDALAQRKHWRPA